MEKDYIMNGNNFNQKARVHHYLGICRTIIGCSKGSGSGNEPKVLRRWKRKLES